VRADGVRVRYTEDGRRLRVTVEGELPDEVVARLVEDARAKLSALEGTEYRARRLTG
jgi:hypothetical protein